MNKPKPRIVANKINQVYEEHKGILPPQAIDAEEAVLGAMLLEKDAIQEILGFILNDEVFYKDEHRIIFRAIKSLHEDFKAVDFITVTQELSRTGELVLVGGAYKVTELTMKINSAVNITFHAQILIEKWMRRVAIQMSTRLSQAAYAGEDDIFELITQAQTELINMHESLNIQSDESTIEIGKKALAEIAKARESEGGVTGIPGGIIEMDRMSSGWQPGDSIIIAARPGMGKTTLALNILKNAVVGFGYEGAFFSLEMRNVALFKKMIATETGISPSKLMKGQLDEADWAQIHHKIAKILTNKIHLIDKCFKFSQLRAKIITLKAKHDIKFVVIDYMQLAELETGNKGNREQEISKISRGIKLLAKELEIPIISLSQLSRAVESRPDKRPMLSDLRESGSIEQDADVIIFPFRPEYYKIEVDENGNSLKNKAEIIFAKNRNGPLGSVLINCDLAKSKFYSAEERFHATHEYNPNQFHEPIKEEDPF
ncbi:MAG: replicative DNA helicase [Bacteroidota bacterium]